jgi:excisionase family DNA binding protein
MTYANRTPAGLAWEATTRGRHAVAAERLAKLQARLDKLQADRDAPTDPEPASSPPAGADPPESEHVTAPGALAAWAFHYSGGEELLRTSEAARLLQVSTRTVVDWAQKGKLRTILTPGGHRRFFASSVLAVRATMWEGVEP